MRVVILGKAREDATVIRYEVKVPDELDRMVVLDASYPVRQLLGLAGKQGRSRLRPSVSPRRDPAARSGSSAEALRSGRDPPDAEQGLGTHLRHRRSCQGRRGLDDPGRDRSRGPGHPGRRGGHHLDLPQERGRLPDFSGLLMEALRSAGIDTKATVEVDGQPSLGSWSRPSAGRRPATPTSTAGTSSSWAAWSLLDSRSLQQFVAETRDLLVNVPLALVERSGPRRGLPSPLPSDLPSGLPRGDRG